MTVDIARLRELYEKPRSVPGEFRFYWLEMDEARFMLELRNAFPALLTRVEAAESECERLREALKPFADLFPSMIADSMFKTVSRDTPTRIIVKAGAIYDAHGVLNRANASQEGKK